MVKDNLCLSSLRSLAKRSTLYNFGLFLATTNFRLATLDSPHWKAFGFPVWLVVHEFALLASSDLTLSGFVLSLEIVHPFLFHDLRPPVASCGLQRPPEAKEVKKLSEKNHHQSFR